MQDLTRFLSAQEHTYATALAELRSGRKRTHWMWFIFPQLAGLGKSPTAQHYAIQNLEEAKDYLQHPLLGARLLEITKVVVNLEGHHSAEEIFGYPDHLKFHSSMTLFHVASGEIGSIFQEALEGYFGGALDQKTLELLCSVGL